MTTRRVTLLLPLLLSGLIATGVGSDSPEDRFANDRDLGDWMNDLVEADTLGASEIWAILDNQPQGDGKNTTPWIAGDPARGVNVEFLQTLSSRIALANSAGIRVEVALFEMETFPARTQQQRLALARAVAQAFRGLDVLICLSEEAPSRAGLQTYLELVDAIHAVDPAARVTIHNENFSSDEERLLAPLAQACRDGRIRLFGISGQARDAADVQRFLLRWRPEFPASVVVRVTEIGPFPGGIPQQPNVESRRYFYVAALSGTDARIYKGANLDLTRTVPSILPWSEAYRQAGLAQRLARREGAIWSPQTVGLDGSCSIIAATDGSPAEVRIWWPDGDGSASLPAGTWWVERLSTITGQPLAPTGLVRHSGGTLRIDRPAGLPNTDSLVVLRTPARVRELNAAALVGMNEPGLDVNNDGRIDAADLRTEGTP